MFWWRVAMPRRLMVLIVLGLIATATDFLPVKMAVPILGAVFIVVSTRGRGVPGGHNSTFGRQATGWFEAMGWRSWVVAALVLSAAGDVFMSNQARGGDPVLFTGIAMYLVAHLAYIAAAMARGRFRWDVFVVIFVSVGSLAIFTMVPRIESMVIAGAIVVYTGVSAVSLAAATGITERRGRVHMSLAIGLILLSDIAIGFRLFLDFQAADALILPTYFASHVVLTRDAVVLD